MITKLYTQNPDYKRLEELTQSIEQGALIIYPTGIGYALGCNPLKMNAVEQLYALKQSNMRKQRFAIMCHDLTEASLYAKIDNFAFHYLKEHHAEPITFILPVTNKLPKQLKQSREIGIRFSLHSITSLILEHLECPLITASLPIRKDEIEYLTNPELIDEVYGNDVFTIIDGGTQQGLKTAIHKIENDNITELRPFGPILL